MGYELNKLKQMYGLSTPTMATSVMPVAPVAPVAPTDGEITPEAQTAYDTALAKYNADLAAYSGDKSAYEAYQAEYQRRLRETPMYGANQFTAITDYAKKGTEAAKPATVEELYQRYLNREGDAPGIAAWKQQFGEGPLTDAKINMFLQGAQPEITTRGIVPPDLYKQTGSYYGGVLSAPGSGGFSGNAIIPAAANTNTVTGGTGNDTVTVRADTGNTGITVTNPVTPGVVNTGVDKITLNLPDRTTVTNPTITLDNPDDQYLFNIPNRHIEGPHMTDGYSNGGAVRAFSYGGLNSMADKYNIMNMANPTDLPTLPDVEPVMLASAPTSTMTDASPVAARSVTPVAAPTARPTPPVPAGAPAVAPQTIGGLGGQVNLADLLSKYTGESSYAKELAEARKSATAESAKFEEMITKALASEAESGPSKAEMYFRLAAAFGAPTKTGSFMESVGTVSGELAKQAKETRESQKASKALRLQLGLEGQKARIASAKEDLNTLRALAGEEMKDKRAIATELIKEYVNSGKPQSEAGRVAKDLGLKPGTPEYEAKVSEVFNNSVEAKMAQVNATLASLQLRQEEAKKLTAAELKLKEETEGFVAAGEQALKDLKQAYKLNPNTFDSSLVDVAQQKMLETFGSKDPRVIATRTQANLLSKQAVGKLRSFFGGNPTEGERAILIGLEGLDAKSKEERAIIMRNTYQAVQAKLERDRKRLNEIKAGLYRETTSEKIED